jgi:hypothetical protein
MKITNILIIVILIGLSCCQKGNINDYQSNGKITGPDPGICICCGGWHIVIDSVTYNFDSVPARSNINLLKETFPVLVKLDWQLSGPGHCPKWITIQRIIKE